MTTKQFGYFTPQDPTLPGIRFGNWGSRPYEYAWAAQALSVEGQRVIDLGTGLPSEHTWHQYVQQALKPKSYVGIDFDDRIRNEEIRDPDHQMLWMDMTDLQFPPNSFDICYSISTFEHIPKAEDFLKAIQEIHRVLVPNGRMVVTLDEIWDIRNSSGMTWNDLERDLLTKQLVPQTGVSFGMADFASLVSEWFTPSLLPPDKQLPLKSNADPWLLYHPYWNSTVSYGVFDRVLPAEQKAVDNVPVAAKTRSRKKE